MKRFLIIFFILCFTLPSNAAFWNKKDKIQDAELQGKGYAGTLPNLENKFQKKEKKISTPLFESKKDFNDPNDIKPAPVDNPAFVDIITKKDKTSEFLKDANEVIPMLERLVDCIEEEGSVQLFVTRANTLTMNIDHLTVKYDGQPESYYASFRQLMNVNRYVKTISLLRKEAIMYQRYLAYQSAGSIYNPDNINQQLQYLLEELNNAIMLLRQES